MSVPALAGPDEYQLLRRARRSRASAHHAFVHIIGDEIVIAPLGVVLVCVQL